MSGNDSGMGGIPPELERAMKQELERRQRISECISHFYTGDYVALNSADYEVLQVSWEGVNELTPIVLLSRANRKALGVEIGDVVKVECNGKTLPALVDRQFKALFGGVSVNRILAHVLGLKVRQAVENVEEATTGDFTGSMVKVSSLI